ncbi:MAG: hypothetical protein JSV05_02215 [Candidatus Bathyarchaeota archaeon]|nr:MAG: hypothetical protein JSV05_02215 [Candidatus Bathyarchaeota archaeon]
MKEEETKIPLDLSEAFEDDTKEEFEEQPEKTQSKNQNKEELNLGDRIKQNIDKVKAKDGIIGYILRNVKSASIDLKESGKIIDYAVLSSSALEASQKLSDTFDLGDIKHILVQGNTVKLLSFSKEETKISVFMEQKVDHIRVYKDLLS